MKCRLCGGTLKYNNGVYICDNCGNKENTENFFEDIQVFMCYTETDENGKRSRDSVIAQELYKKITAAGINVFFQRVSADGLFGSEYIDAYEAALNKSKIVLILGTQTDYFENLTENYYEKIKDKIIIPVFYGISPHDLPKELRSLQAVNYEIIGADIDLTNRILKLLGKESSINTHEMRDAVNSKKFLIIGIIIALVSAFALYIIFGTPYILKNKKYTYAETLTEQKNYIKAIEILHEIDGYKNSDSLLNDIYNKYDGYFYNDDQSVCLHLNTDNSKKTEIAIEIYNDSETIIINSSAAMDKGKINFNFNNSVKTGLGTIVLENDKVNLHLHIDTDNTEFDQSFDLLSKADAPKKKAVTKEKIIEWLSSRTTKADILMQGYELKKQNDLYSIENSDIKLLFLNYDLISMGNDRENNNYTIKDTEEEYLYAISAPAAVLMPDLANMSSAFTVENDIIFLPFFEASIPADDFLIYPHHNPDEENNLSSYTTTVFSSSKNVLGNYYWKALCENVLSRTLYNDSPIQTEIVGENKDDFILCEIQTYEYANGTKDKYSPGKYTLYNLNKQNLKSTKIKELSFATDPDASVLKEFLGEYANGSKTYKIFSGIY